MPQHPDLLLLGVLLPLNHPAAAGLLTTTALRQLLLLVLTALPLLLLLLLCWRMLLQRLLLALGLLLLLRAWPARVYSWVGTGWVRSGNPIRIAPGSTRCCC
jgi:hypothetical protein